MPYKRRLPAGWAFHLDNLGAIYYYNNATGESTYDRPRGRNSASAANNNDSAVPYANQFTNSASANNNRGPASSASSHAGRVLANNNNQGRVRDAGANPASMALTKHGRGKKKPNFS